MLSSFFKKASQSPATQSDLIAKTSAPSTPALDSDPEIEEIPPPSSSQVTRASSPLPLSGSQQAQPLKRKESHSYSISQTSKRSSSAAARSTKKQKVGTKSGQTMLSSFFSTPSKSSQSTNEIIELELDDGSLAPTQQSSTLSQSDGLEQLENDSDLASSLNPSQTTQVTLSNRSGSSSQSKPTKSTAASWSDIMAPLVVPLCTVHMEPTKELTVNKPGPNKGKKFYVCSRFAVPQGSIFSEYRC